jgi:hypothetical protein
MFAALVPCAALAAPPGKSDVATDKARELHLEADALYKQGQYARARVAYIAAWALKKHWQIAGSLGDTELKLEMYRDAAEHLAYFLRASPSQPPSAEAQKLYAEARSKIGMLVVTVDKAGAEVEVDGKVVGKAPLEDPVFVEPGHHVVEARAGAALASAQVDIAVGAERPVQLLLAGAQGRTGPSVPVVVTGAVLGAGGIATGIALFVVAGQKASSADSQLGQIKRAGTTCSSPPQPGACTSLHSANVSASTLHNASIPLLAIGSGLAAATVLYAVWPRPKAESARGLNLLPVVGATGAGVWLTGAF